MQNSKSESKGQKALRENSTRTFNKNRVNADNVQNVENLKTETDPVIVDKTELTIPAKLNKEINCSAAANGIWQQQRRACITTERMNELRHKAQNAIKTNRTFTIRGCFNSVRNALLARGWVEKLDVHRKQMPTGICQIAYDDLTHTLPKRRLGETRHQYIAKCEQNLMSRFLEHMPIDFLWTNRKERCDYIDQTRNPAMTINKFQRAPFTSKEGLCSQLKDFHWFYEEGTAELYFPRCYNVWSPDELGEFIENYKLTACISLIRWIVDECRKSGFDSVFSSVGKIPASAVDFAYKRCNEYIDACQHNDIDVDGQSKIWEHDWDSFLHQQHLVTNRSERIFVAQQPTMENILKTGTRLLESSQNYWPQSSLDGYQNLWIIKPANKCRGRGIQLMDNLKDIINVVKPLVISKSRYVVQKYMERPLIIHRTKFDIRQWFLITNVQPLVVWMYKECYLRFSSQVYNLASYHESVHLTNHAIQKKYTNGKRDKRLPNENMWDSYSFQAYLRQIGRQDIWLERIYPGMKKAIIGAMLASQENMDRRPNTFELFGADFMICESFYPWLIEINSSPDLAATTSVTARMCPQCLEDVIKVVIDRRLDAKADVGNFELIYRQAIPATPAYMGLNFLVKGKQLVSKTIHNHALTHYRKERAASASCQRQKSVNVAAPIKEVMPTYNATELCRDKLTVPITVASTAVMTTLRLSQLQSNIRSKSFSLPTRVKLHKKATELQQDNHKLKPTPYRRFDHLIFAPLKKSASFEFLSQNRTFEEKVSYIRAQKLNKRNEAKASCRLSAKAIRAACASTQSCAANKCKENLLPMPLVANISHSSSARNVHVEKQTSRKKSGVISADKHADKKRRISNATALKLKTYSATENEVNKQKKAKDNTDNMHAIGKHISTKKIIGLKSLTQKLQTARRHSGTGHSSIWQCTNVMKPSIIRTASAYPPITTTNSINSK